jgi:hypothetical protein
VKSVICLKRVAYLFDHRPVLMPVRGVSAIHGRLLTAWSVADVLGPELVNYMREYQIAHGADKASADQTVLHVMAGLLVIGFTANCWFGRFRKSIGWQKESSEGARGNCRNRKALCRILIARSK